MRGPVSDQRPAAAGGAYRISGPVPAVFHEDPLFLELCAAFDELLGPFVTALDCFPAYLDPWLAPADYLGWLATLVGQEPPPGQERPSRAHIAGAVRAYRARGTARGVRAAAAAAARVPDKDVMVTEGGTVTYSDTAGAAVCPAFSPAVVITVKVPAGTDTAAVTARVRDAAGPDLPVFAQLHVTVEES
jgi:phage tail-like protein